MVNPFRDLLSRPPATKAEKIRVSKLGNKLATYAEAWDALSANFPTRGERRKVRDHYAALLEVEPRTLNNIAKPEFQRPERIKEIQAHYLDVSSKKLSVVKAAISVIAGSETPEDAALRAETTVRTVYRRVNTLLALHQLVIGDLKHMTNQQRTALAQQLEGSIGTALEQKQQKLVQKLSNTREIRTKRV